jgi:D-alanyl-D-alanine carboxypeptidase
VRGHRPLALISLAGVAGLLVAIALVLGDGGVKPTPLSASAEPGAPAIPAAAPVVEPVVEAELEVEAAGPASLAYADGAFVVAIKPQLTAASYIAIDNDTGEILIAKNDRQPRPIASLTKVMTALIAIQAGQLARKARVPVEATRVEPNREGLIAGRWYRKKLLLYSALLVSANDSADTLAAHVGEGSLKRFYRLMNARARKLGMTDTVYTSASGLNDVTNLSSARDQAVVAREALASPLLASIVRTHRRLVDWPPPTYKKEWLNHNRMLVTYPGTYGVKTGYTTVAGGCLVVAVRRDGHDVIAVVLGSKNIWADMPRLVDAAFARFAEP